MRYVGSTFASTRNTQPSPACEPHDLVGPDTSSSDPADRAETLLDERLFAHGRPDRHAAVGLLEADIGVRQQPELQAEPLRDGHLSLGRDSHRLEYYGSRHYRAIDRDREARFPDGWAVVPAVSLGIAPVQSVRRLTGSDSRSRYAAEVER